jgi:hypothetical protein
MQCNHAPQYKLQMPKQDVEKAQSQGKIGGLARMVLHGLLAWNLHLCHC